MNKPPGIESDALDHPDPVPRERYDLQKKELDGEEDARGKPHPWRRFWARGLDYLLFFAFVDCILWWFDLRFREQMLYIISIALIFVWNFIEAGLLSTWGTTPGKWMLHMWVRMKSGEKVTYLDALNRSFSLWFLGVGAGIFPISFITLTVACTKLSNLGETSWDRRGGYRVHCGKVGGIRTVITLAIYLIIVGYGYIGYLG